MILSFFVCNITFANKNKNTWDYPLIDYRGWVIKGSKDHYKFQSDLREDKDVLKEFKKIKIQELLAIYYLKMIKLLLMLLIFLKKLVAENT